MSKRVFANENPQWVGHRDRSIIVSPCILTQTVGDKRLAPAIAALPKKLVCKNLLIPFFLGCYL
jgi:hypothetical protein